MNWLISPARRARSGSITNRNAGRHRAGQAEPDGDRADVIREQVVGAVVARPCQDRRAVADGRPVGELVGHVHASIAPNTSDTA